MPESIGGERNWDYCYTWLRDAAFTLASLLKLGFSQEARDFMNWLDKRCDKRSKLDKIQIQPVYSVHSETDLKEEVLNLEGYAGSKPVRIGNKEGAFSACSFWFVDCLARMEDHLDDARLHLERLLSLANHVGLYAEEIDGMGRPLGNFPQAFTHLTLIQACLTLDQAIEESLTLKH